MMGNAGSCGCGGACGDGGGGCSGGACAPRPPPNPYAANAALATHRGYLAMIGVEQDARGAGLTAEEVRLAQAQLEAQLARERAAREEREATRAREAEREGRTYAAVGSGITQAGDTARAGIRTAAELEQERIRAARDEAVARINRDTEAERNAIRRMEIERGIVPLASTSSSSGNGKVIAIGAAAAAALYVLSKRRRGRR